MTDDHGQKPGKASLLHEHPDDAAARRDPEAALMMRNGITRTTSSHYHVDGYRYTSLADAIAQVNRGARDRERRR
ncbi:hypothetical protein GCM10023232_19950 [Sphingosinicella ginsenosidimutans]|uniref:Uncharacterized protein n=1 Tax=Allosphingosinicella ginsenosidimutans TaxID=1176539 RepID=A0A5C6TTH5_9SPHN|nr:hypothetical protein [Sphingosinicella ginsenosidimutans]TXC63018.1 hypothetical protein FRZ32_04655 [Sphingosinicella ginsenosidimutans]